MKKLILGLLLAFSVPAMAASYQAKDGNGVLQYFQAGGSGSSGTPYVVQHQLVDSAGANVATVTSAGAVKVDATSTTQPIVQTIPSGLLMTNINDTSNGTFTVVSSSGSTVIRPYKIIVTANNYDTFTLKYSGTTFLGPMYGSFVLDLFPLTFPSGAGNNLTLTKGSASTPVTVTVIYTQQ